MGFKHSPATQRCLAQRPCGCWDHASRGEAGQPPTGAERALTDRASEVALSLLLRVYTDPPGPTIRSQHAALIGRLALAGAKPVQGAL